MWCRPRNRAGIRKTVITKRGYEIKIDIRMLIHAPTVCCATLRPKDLHQACKQLNCVICQMLLYATLLHRYGDTDFIHYSGFVETFRQTGLKET